MRAAINRIVQRFASKAASDLVTTFSEADRPVGAPTHFIARQAPTTMTNTLTYSFTPSPLVAALSPAVADMIRVLYADARVQSAAAGCRLKLMRLFEIAMYRSLIAEAIEAATEADEDLDIASVRPENLVALLNRRSEAVDSAIEEAIADHQLHDARSREIAQRHMPLRSAVSRKLDLLVTQVDHARARLDAMKGAHLIGDGGYDRHQQLRSLGLSEAQIELVASDAVAPAQHEATLRQQIADALPVIDRLKAFSASPVFDAGSIAGISVQIDALIEERARSFQSEMVA